MDFFNQPELNFILKMAILKQYKNNPELDKDILAVKIHNIIADGILNEIKNGATDWKETETFRKLYLEAKNAELELMLDETLK